MLDKTLTTRLLGKHGSMALALFAAITLILVPIFNLAVPADHALHLPTTG